MNAAQWTEWGNHVKAFAEWKGCQLTKIVLSESQEADWDMAYMNDNEEASGMHVDEKNAAAYLCGVKVMFTNRLGAGRALFVLEDVTTKPAGTPISLPAEA